MQNENLKILVGVCFVIGLIAFGIEYFRVSDDMQVNVKAYSEIKDKIEAPFCASELASTLDTIQVKSMDENSNLTSEFTDPLEKLSRNDREYLVYYLPLQQCALQNMFNIQELGLSATRLVYLKGRVSVLDTLIGLGTMISEDMSDCEKAVLRIQQYCPLHVETKGFNSPFIFRKRD